MAEPQLQPDELDRIEDALEDLELVDTIDAIDDPSPLVRARLADYRALLIASRDALPMVDVPPGVLAGVLAEARRMDDDLVELSAADERPSQQDSWWSRVRKSFLIPTLAVVGTAALILIVVTPTYDGSTGDAAEVVARVETPASTPASPPPGAAPAVKAEAAEQDPAAAADEPAEVEEEEAPLYEIATARNVDGDGAIGGAKLPGKAAVGSNEQANADAEPPKAAEDDRARWDFIERGDKARTSGDCFQANNEYQRALDDGNDSVRARALVGLGLCAAEQGNTARAQALWEEARALDPEVAGYIDTQRADEKRKARKPMPRKKESSRRKASMPADAYESDPLPGDARNANPYKD